MRRYLNIKQEHHTQSTNLQMHIDSRDSPVYFRTPDETLEVEYDDPLCSVCTLWSDGRNRPIYSWTSSRSDRALHNLPCSPPMVRWDLRSHPKTSRQHVRTPIVVRGHKYADTLLDSCPYSRPSQSSSLCSSTAVCLSYDCSVVDFVNLCTDMPHRWTLYNRDRTKSR